jgi:hypothetical protein
MKPGRRTFLLAIAAAAAAAGIFRSRHGLKVFLKGAKEEAGPRAGINPFVRDGKSLVSAVGGTDPAEMVRRAVSLIGGFGPLALGGKTVLVKPNVVGDNVNPTTTNPAVVAAVVRALREAGAKEVFVGDMSALVRGSTSRNMERTGIAAAARDAGARTLFFEDHGWVKVEVKGRYLKEVSITEWIRKVDRVVNLRSSRRTRMPATRSASRTSSAPPTSARGLTS